MKGVKVVHVLGKFYWYGICYSPVLDFQMLLCEQKLLFGGFLDRTPQMQLTFLTSDDKQDDASDMLQFYEVLRNGRNWAKKSILLHILRGFLFTPLYTLWDTHQDFANWKTLLR